MGPNNSFKPNTNRCALGVGLTQVLGSFGEIMAGRFLMLLFVAFTQPAMAGGSVDYRAERLKFAADPSYNAYSLAVKQRALLDEHFRLANDPETNAEQINAPLHKLLELYPIGIQVNYAVADFLEHVATHLEGGGTDSELLDIAKSKREKANAIIQSIIGFGDGKSADTAFQVINTMEEYAVLDHLDLKPSKQFVFTPPNGAYDVFKAVDSKGSEHTVYFDISIFYGRRIPSE